MNLNAVFKQKEDQFEPKACVVEKIVELDPDVYADFRSNMLRDQPFIAEFNSAMRMQGKGSAHCLLVLGEEHEDGVLIDTQGYDYARYAAFIPGARNLLMVDERHAEQVFANQARQMEGADPANTPAWIEHARELAETNTGAYGPDVHVEYLRLLREFGEAFHRIDCIYAETPVEIFNGNAFCRPDQLLPMADWINNGGDLESAMEGLRAGGFDPVDYAASKLIEEGLQLETDGIVHLGHAETQGGYGLSDDQMLQLYERLQAREEVGELLRYENRDAFTLRFNPEFLKQDAPAQQQEPLTQEDLAVMHARHILWCYGQPGGEQADFSGRLLSGLDFARMDFCNADFTGAAIHQCRMGEACFDDSDFTGAKMRGVSAYQGEFNGSKFTGATLEYSEFPEAQFEGADFTQAEITECDGLDDVTQGPSMAMGG